MKRKIQEKVNEHPIQKLAKSRKSEKAETASTVEAKSKTLENSTPKVKKEITTRKGSYTIDPKHIVIDFKDKSGNPRLDYGDDFEELKKSITLYGIQSAIKLYKGDDDKWHLAHGYRRMKAVTELLEAGVVIENVPFDQVDNDEQQILIEHFTLNSGKPLNDVEMAEGLKRLSILSNEDNVAELARRVGMDYQKAHNLWTFIGKAGTKVKTEVAKGTISFNVGFTIVKKAENISEQNNLLKEGIDEARKTGKTKVRTKHIAKVNRDKMPLDVKIKLMLAEASKSQDADIRLINIITLLLDGVKNNEDSETILKLLKVSETAEVEE